MDFNNKEDAENEILQKINGNADRVLFDSRQPMGGQAAHTAREEFF